MICIYMKEIEILETIFLDSKNQNLKIKSAITDNVNILIIHIGNNKSLISAIVTSCLKKIINPLQDIRLHRVDFNNGYSART